MATLADGSEFAFDTYEIAVLWHGRRRVIFADEAETTPLVGVMLLEGNDLNIQVRTGGRVLIQEIVCNTKSSASVVGDKRLVFNIKSNNYCLVVRIN